MVAGAVAAVTALVASPGTATPMPTAKETDAPASIQVKKTKKRSPTGFSTRPAHWTAPAGPGSHTSEPKVRPPAQIAIEVARKQLGKPYRWAGVGPNSFDCSGFTLFVYDKAGIGLPHNSGRQFNSVKRVPLDEMKPGDLVFSGGWGIHHVGLYIGDGKMIHSPHSGRDVEVAPLHSNLRGAGRPAR